MTRRDIAKAIGVNAVVSIVSEALKLNKDDEIFRTDGVYFSSTTPPYRIGSETVQGRMSSWTSTSNPSIWATDRGPA